MSTIKPWFEPLAPCPAVSLRDLRLRAGSRVLVDGLSLSIHPGQLWCIVGPNGVGKSTLMGVLAGLRARWRSRGNRWRGRHAGGAGRAGPPAGLPAASRA
jgi:ABC-type molybdenum transport system ATPase subunit/photorepair protein PhrA